LIDGVLIEACSINWLVSKFVAYENKILSLYVLRCDI
jgi:hypothetical protein